MFLPLSTIAVSTTPAKKETNYIIQQRDVSNSLSFLIRRFLMQSNASKQDK